MFNRTYDVFRLVLDHRNYRSSPVYIKTLMSFVVLGMIVWSVVNMVFSNFSNANFIMHKITDHQKFVKDGKNRIKGEMQAKVTELNKMSERFVKLEAELRESMEGGRPITYSQERARER